MLLKRGLGFIALGTLLSSAVWAADVNLSDLDKAVRSSTSNSIMFKRGPEAQMEMERRAQQEAEEKARQKAEQEAKLKKDSVDNEKDACLTHYHVGKTVRKAIQELEREELQRIGTNP